MAGAYFTVYLRTIEYCVLEDPCPSPRSTWQYYLVTARDVYLPFEIRAVAGRSPVQPRDTKKQPGGSGSTSKRPDIERQPLAAPRDSFATAAARLLQQLFLQYLLYDCLLTLFVKPLGDATAVDGGGPRALPLLSTTSLQASIAFTTCLYLHFAISYKGTMLALSLVHPALLYRCPHMFREPWRGLSSVSELWQRWHQLFRLTFIRLAYRPARAAVRRLLGKRSSGSGSASSASGAVNGSPVLSGGEQNAMNGHGRSAAGGRSGGWTAAIEEAVSLVAVFLLSGIIHEYMCWAAFGTARGWQLGFFLAHGLVALMEQMAASAIRGSFGVRGSPLVPVLQGALRAACTVFCTLSSVAFMRPWIEAGYHQDFWHPVSPVAWVLQRLAGERVAAI